jgi:hypothetical protein
MARDHPRPIPKGANDVFRSLALIGRATRVQHQADKPSVERTTTVTDMSPMIWSPNALAARTHPADVPDRDEVCAGLHRPCRARPAGRSLVAEDRSAGGVRDQTGPNPLSVLGPWAPGPQGRERSATVTTGNEEPQVTGRPPKQRG